MFDMAMLRLPEAVPSINQVWASEPRDFTPWLADNLGVLDVLGLGRLEVVEREKIVPGTLRALDLLAARPTGELVAIENQFGKADHDHLTRGLAYAVGLQAQTLVVVAEEHLNEFRAVARYLNELAERSDAAQRIGVYLVQVGVERIEQYLVPRFSVIESPNPWTEAADGTVSAPYIGSLEEFLAAVADEAEPAASDLCRWWDATGGTMRFSRKSVSLDRPHPTKAQPLSFAVVYTSGQCWLNRGYLIDSGAVSGDRVEEFDALVAQALPQLRLGEKSFYFIGSQPAPVDGVRSLLEWLEAQ